MKDSLTLPGAEFACLFVLLCKDMLPYIVLCLDIEVTADFLIVMLVPEDRGNPVSAEAAAIAGEKFKKKSLSLLSLSLSLKYICAG